MPNDRIPLVVSIIALIVGAAGITYTSSALSDLSPKISTIETSLSDKASANEISSLRQDLNLLSQQQKATSDQQAVIRQALEKEVSGLKEALAAGEQKLREAEAARQKEAERLKSVETELEQRKLQEAARKEGRVVFYSSQTIEQQAAVKKLFEAKYPGITLEIVRLLGGPLTERLQAEFSTGKRVADVIMTASELTPLYKKQGWLERYISPELRAIPDAYKDPDGMFVSPRLPFVIVAYNTKLVKPEEVPKSWEQVADPKWKGRIAVADPFLYPGSLAWFGTMKKIMGDKWLSFVSGIRELKPILTTSFGPAGKTIATGEASIGICLTSSIWPDLVKGNPISAANLGPLVAYPTDFALLKDAPHPNAARLFIDWFLSEETMKFFAEDGDPVARGYAPPAFSALMPQVKYKLADLTEQEQESLKREMGLPWK